MLRSLGCLALIAMCGPSNAQAIDSVHVFDALTVGGHTSASAHALAWRLHRADARHVTLKGAEITTVREGLAHYGPAQHRYGPIPDLKHIAMVFTKGRPTALGITEDLDRIINFTARQEYRISTMAEHIKVRAVLMELMLRH